MEASVNQQIINEKTLEEREAIEVQHQLCFLLEDTIHSEKQELDELIEDNNAGIEGEVKKPVLADDERHTKEASYEAENCYAQKNPYAREKNYEQINELKPAKDEEKSFLWR